MKKKKGIYIGLVAALALAMTMIVVGCGSNDEEEPVETTATTTTTEATTTTTAAPKDTAVLKTKLESMIEEYGRGTASGDGVTYARVMDMDKDGKKEMLVIHDMTAEIIVNRNGRGESLFSGKCGIQYGQTDTGYQVLINESLSPAAIVIFNSSDEWVDENITAVSVQGEATSTKTLKASTDGENDTPAREELVNFSIDGASVSASEYNNEYTRLTEGADQINPMTPTDLDEVLASM